jgi:epoxyqueuosine reductase
LIVHICCSVDSHYFLQNIQKEYPDEEILGYFYDPNIQPYSEYRLRFLDVAYSCKKLGIKLLEGPYDLESWLRSVKGLENEPEKGDRCTVCFDKRLETTVKQGIKLGHKSFTTTLLISPKKSQDKLEKIGQDLEKKYGIKWIFKDYRSGNGTQIQGQIVKENSLYRQNYCGCIFGLKPQRQYQDKLMDEMFSSLGQQIMPSSIEQRLQLYHKRDYYEEHNIKYKIIKNRILNYRLLSGRVKVKKRVVPSYILAYSTLQNNKMNGRIEYTHSNINYLNRNEVKVLDINNFNSLANSSYKNVYELLYNPLVFEDELNIRHQITKNPYDLSTIVILDKIEDEKYEIELNTKIYEDVQETILIEEISKKDIKIKELLKEYENIS